MHAKQADSRPITRGCTLGVAERVIMLGGGVFVALALVALTSVLPQIESALAQTADDRLLVKMLVMVIGVTMVFGAPLAGFLVDRTGTHHVLLVAGLCYGFGGTAGLYLSSLPLLIASRLVVGVAAGAIAATSMTLINARFVDGDRRRWMGLHVAVGTGGSLILYPLAGLLGEAGWRFPFALYALGFALAGLSVLVTDKPMHVGVEQVAETEGTAAVGLMSWFPFRFLFLAVIIGGITYLPVVYLPFVLRDAGVSSPLIISLVGLADAILTVIMAISFARARRRLSSRGAFMFSFSCTGAGMSIVSIWPSVPGIVAGMIVFGLGLGWFVPNLMTAAAADVEAGQQGRTVGLVKAAHYVAAPLCVLLIEPATRASGPEAALVAAALLSFSLLLLFSLPIKRLAPPRVA